MIITAINQNLYHLNARVVDLLKMVNSNPSPKPSSTSPRYKASSSDWFQHNEKRTPEPITTGSNLFIVLKIFFQVSLNKVCRIHSFVTHIIMLKLLNRYHTAESTLSTTVNMPELLNANTTRLFLLFPLPLQSMYCCLYRTYVYCPHFHIPLPYRHIFSLCALVIML